MLQVETLRKSIARLRHAWWTPFVTGALYGLALPPFNHETHSLFAGFPFLIFFVLIPLFGFSVLNPRKKALRQSYFFGIAASATQLYWIANVNIEGLRAIIFLGLVVACLFVALYYFICAWLFRAIYLRFPRWYPLLFPAALLLVDYLRSVSEIAFPWMFLGYALTPLLPLSQFASISGVFGLTYLSATGNTVLFSWFTSILRRNTFLPVSRGVIVFGVTLIALTLWGTGRMMGGRAEKNEDPIRVALLQTNMNQAQWGHGSLDSSVAITENMVYQAKREANPDLIVLPESSIFAYLLRTPALRQRVTGWADSVHTPLILGTLHWDLPQQDSYYDHHVYNVALHVNRGLPDIEIYRKMWLLPFSEALPFESSLPILNRINLGESDFQRGMDPVVFDVSEQVKAGPFICYEMIFPQLVRQRVRQGANLLVNITNDGWFGRSSAAHHHATMSRMRAIETGTSMARCANSGISMLVDQYGRHLGKTRLYERTTLSGEVSIRQVPTLFVKFGNWPIPVAVFLLLGAILYQYLIGPLLVNRAAKPNE